MSDIGHAVTPTAICGRMDKFLSTQRGDMAAKDLLDSHKLAGVIVEAQIDAAEGACA